MPDAREQEYVSPRYVSMRKRRGTPKAKLQPPLTPMIDVTFLLLLYFILTAEFRPNEGPIPGTLPQESKAVSAAKFQPIEVTIHPVANSREICEFEMSGSLERLTNPEELYLQLRGRKDRIGSDEVPVIIVPLPGIRWGFVVEAYNQAYRAQFKTITFSTPA